MASALITDSAGHVDVRLRFYDAESGGNEIERIGVNVPLVNVGEGGLPSVFASLNAASDTPVSGYTFTGYSSSLSAFGAVGTLRGRMSESLVGIYTATVRTTTDPRFAAIVQGRTYLARNAVGKVPRFVVVDGTPYAVSAPINNTFYEVLDFAGFVAGTDYRVQVVFVDGSTWIIEQSDSVRPEYASQPAGTIVVPAGGWAVGVTLDLGYVPPGAMVVLLCNATLDRTASGPTASVRLSRQRGNGQWSVVRLESPEAEVTGQVRPAQVILNYVDTEGSGASGGNLRYRIEGGLTSQGAGTVENTTITALVIGG